MLGLMKFKKLFWKKSDEHDKLDELDHELLLVLRREKSSE